MNHELYLENRFTVNTFLFGCHELGQVKENILPVVHITMEDM